MQLTLVRHGEAAPPVYGDDVKRPLTSLGHEQAKHTAQLLKAHIEPEVFVVSPLRRAQETLAHLQHYFPQVPVVVCDAIKPDDDAKVAIEWLSYLPYQSIVVVCHMNVVAHMAAKLTSETFHPFALAEARVYEQVVIAKGLSTLRKTFIPH
jgi:phosphohistidine phosphatase